MDETFVFYFDEAVSATFKFADPTILDQLLDEDTTELVRTGNAAFGLAVDMIANDLSEAVTVLQT